MDDAKKRLLCPVGRCDRSHQCDRVWSDRDCAEALRSNRQRAGGPQRHHRCPDRGSHRHGPGERGVDRCAQAHAVRRVRLLSLQARGARGEPGGIRAAHRRLPCPRHRLLLLQRRRRLFRHRVQGLADRTGSGLPDHRGGHPQDGGQRSADHRQLPRVRLRCQVRRRIDSRGVLRRRIDGPHVDEGLRSRGDGPGGLRRRGDWPPIATAARRRSSCSRRSHSTRTRSSKR